MVQVETGKTKDGKPPGLGHLRGVSTRQVRKVQVPPVGGGPGLAGLCFWYCGNMSDGKGRMLERASRPWSGSD